MCGLDLECSDVSWNNTIAYLSAPQVGALLASARRLLTCLLIALRMTRVTACAHGRIKHATSSATIRPLIRRSVILSACWAYIYASDLTYWYSEPTLLLMEGSKSILLWFLMLRRLRRLDRKAPDQLDECPLWRHGHHGAEHCISLWKHWPVARPRCLYITIIVFACMHVHGVWLCICTYKYILICFHVILCSDGSLH